MLAKFLDNLLTYGFEKYGKYYSKYRGFVYDREDPEHRGRLQLTVPDVAGRSVIQTWALPANYSGVNFGTQNLPNRGDLVWVEFERGDARRPIWHHGYHGTNDTKAEPLKDYDNRWFKTPAGHVIELDDTNSIIRITTAGTLEIFKDGEALQPAVLGDTLQAKLEELLDILTNAKVMTSLGPQFFMPPTLQKIIDLKTELAEIKSANVTITE